MNALSIRMLAFAGMLASSAGVAQAISVRDAVAVALEKNPSMASTRQERAIAMGDLTRARYWNQFNPTVGGGADQRRFDKGGTGTQAAGSVTLEVEVAGQRWKRIETAEKNLERIDAEIRNAERLLVADVQEAFYGSLYLARRLALLRRVQELNQRLRDASEKRYHAGEVAKLEANLGEIRFSQSRKDVLGAERDHRNAVRGLERLLGRDPTGTLDLQGDLRTRPVRIDVGSAVESALASRPDLDARNAEIARVQAETELTRRRIVPNVTFGAGYDEETEIPGFTDRIIGGRISIPLPLFDRKQAELTTLGGQQSRARYDRNAVVLAVQTEVRDAMRSYEASSEAVRVYESDAIARIDENFGFIETAFQEGKIGLLQLVVVQNDLVATQLSYLESLWDYWRSRIALERAIGRSLDEGGRP